MRDMKATLSQLEVSVAEIKAMLTATLPYLATKADLAELRAELRGELADRRSELRDDLAELRAELAAKPSHAYLWGVLAALITAYAAGLAALTIVR